MRPWKNLRVFMVVQLVHILKTNPVHSLKDDSVNAIDTTQQNDRENIDVSKTQSDPTTAKRTWGRFRWFYHRPAHLNKHYRLNRRPTFRGYRIRRPYRPYRFYRPYRPYRRPVSNHFRYGFRKKYRYRKPTVGFRKKYRYRKPTVRPPTRKTTTTPRPTTTVKPTTRFKPTTPLNPTTKPATKPSPPCREGSTVFDRCQRSCVCGDGKLTDCYRIRREFAHMPKEDRRRYLNAVLTVSTQEPYKTKYETLLTIHKTIFKTDIHKAPYFLPWHRWFVMQFENLLRQIDCKITVPYWDWSLVSATPFKNEFWNGAYGFGGNGLGFPACVRTGPFSVGRNWKLIKSAGGRCLQRTFASFSGIVPGVVQVAKVLAKNLSSFSDFELMLRVNLHDVVHFAIGGTMMTEDGAAAPEFFPHHSFIDKIWSEWQSKSNLHQFNEFFVAQNTTMPGTNLKSLDLLSTKNLPGCVKVKYAPPELGNWNDLIKKLKTMSETNPEALDKLPGMPTASLKEAMFKAFNVDEKERKRAWEMQKELRTKVKVNPSKLSGMEKMLGLKAKDIKNMKAKAG